MDLLVTTAWLEQHIADPNLLVLDATLPPVGITPAPDMHARYQSCHIPGAVFFDIEAFSDSDTTLPHMLSSPERFAAAMGELGVSNRMTLVVYEQGSVFSSPRAWWMLKTYGARQVYLLDGGLNAWVEAGLPTEAGPITRPNTTFHPTFKSDSVKSFAQVQQLLVDHGQVVDARSSGRFDGSAPEPRPGLRSGHMPGAISLPYTELVYEGRFKDPAALMQLFQERGIDLNQAITTTCGSGVTAAAIAFAAEICGARQVSLYDGSWAEYAQQKNAVIETTT